MIPVILESIICFIMFLSGLFILFKIKKTEQNKKLVNYILSFIAFIFYVALVLVHYFLTKGGINGDLPLANVSPLIFSTVFFANFLPNKIRKYYHILIVSFIGAMFVVGVFLYLVKDLITNSYSYDPWMYFDGISHLAVSLLGIWLILTNQINLNKFDFGISLISQYILLFIVIILNIVFKTNFFGLSITSNHNIYGFTFNPWIFSFSIYFIGLALILIIGYFAAKHFQLKYRKRREMAETQKTINIQM